VICGLAGEHGGGPFARGPWTLLYDRALTSLPAPLSARIDPPGDDLPLAPPEGNLFRNNPFREALRETYTVKPVSALTGRSPYPGTREMEESRDRAVHALIEHAWRHPDADRAILAQHALQHEGRSSGEAEELLALLHRVVSSPVWKAARASDRAWAAVPFTFGAADAERAHLTGTIDLVYHDGTEWVVVDFRWDIVNDNLEGLVEYYAPRLRAYCKAWEKLSGEAARGVLFYTRSGDIIDLSRS
jgi:ATP-dependent exoDNAse (exonuclease V) beta subunit